MGISKDVKPVPGWVGGWINIKAALRIAYSNQNCLFITSKRY
jgi:hypothetical protein